MDFYDYIIEYFNHFHKWINEKKELSLKTEMDRKRILSAKIIKRSRKKHKKLYHNKSLLSITKKMKNISKIKNLGDLVKIERFLQDEPIENLDGTFTIVDKDDKFNKDCKFCLNVERVTHSEKV